MKKVQDNTRRFGAVEQSRTFRNISDLFGLSKKVVLDIGCGYGQYLRNFGVGSIGITTTEEEVTFGKVHGLNIVSGNAEDLSNLNQKFEIIWANNLFEHLRSTHAFLMKLKNISQESTIIILGVPVVPKVVSLLKLRWWRGPLASNHINFFTHTTLRLTAEYAGWKVLTVRPFIFKFRWLDLLVRPLAPHMYVVAKNKPNFKYPSKKIHEWEGDEHYRDLLKITNQA